MTRLNLLVKDESNHHKVMYCSSYDNTKLRSSRPLKNMKPTKIQFFYPEEVDKTATVFNKLVAFTINKKGEVSKEVDFFNKNTEAFDTIQECTEHYNSCVKKVVNELQEIIDVVSKNFIEVKY